MRWNGIVGVLLAALALGSCAGREPVTSAAKDRRIHALIVGIDTYRYSQDAGFSDLKGAVGDALRFKAALAEVYGVAVDRAQPGACESANASTITLTDSCATRVRLLDALQAQVAALKPGDTLLFYFAGHGSQYRDDEAHDQDTGYNGTILPSDARNPDGSAGDIFDVELKAIKDRAVAAGIYFVTVFDSCNSATATRDGAAGQARSVAPLAGALPPRVTAPAPVGPGGGYWVHLAAAQDGEEAQETASGAIGARAGVFTSALIDTIKLPGMRDASFGDIIKEVQLRVAQRGHTAQTPSAEGELTAAIGSRSRSPVLIDVAVDGRTVTLRAGALSGVTLGSRYALYRSQADAVARRGQLAVATVTALTASSAALQLDAPLTGAKPGELLAEEIAHYFPVDLITVSNDLPPGPDRDAVEQALGSLAFVRKGPDAASRLSLVEGRVALRADDGTVLSNNLGKASDPVFGQRLEEELRKVARVAQLLALRTQPAPDAPQGQLPVQVCVDVDGYRPTACPPVQTGAMRRIAADKRISATVINRGTAPVYVYVLAIDPFNAVDLILPKPGETDAALRSGLPYRRSQMSFDPPGIYRIVTIASAAPIQAESFQQSGNGARDLAACVSPLERLLCATSEGTRDAGVRAVGDWSAQVTTVLVTPQEQVR